MSAIQTQCRRIRQLFQGLLVLVPIMTCYYWATIHTQYDAPLAIIAFTDTIAEYTQQPLSVTTRVLAALASLLLCSIIMYALTVLIRLFHNYENNNIFTLENAQSYKKLGMTIFYWVGGSVVYSTVISVILSFNNPPGERLIVLGFNGIDAATVLLGGILLIISWVMLEGYKLADEQRHTV
ncbi:DUF2975 domain-containing protein [Photobacterium aphoticum]|uniref:Membrane protein n=1 Tax=Photobacterium aphoticum TaxID=754436 RepID=A0A0J1JCX2_9GAMM|nr:DUF2975 domain-containing protein [Photobacterium aphoticum]KLU99516.1 membrane protein [Photobacterium aphoticum]PSU57114.1 DUF2975 domain-containing protein [Photobacterium aphoticum]GHA52911.1 hypothetical protein GCM10007086_28950 [Photobacterium aphoticum]